MQTILPGNLLEHFTFADGTYTLTKIKISTLYSHYPNWWLQRECGPKNAKAERLGRNFGCHNTTLSFNLKPLHWQH